ncbi:penicillin-binding transpeptidase domain-containing protein [Flammeovirgaceae bacterium SG7u.111]|nr:penicillin-binding transpeptidase domain-containing protein [Flammeovirgaceae bacterium SG7u.132]WPO35286.1 penicillin-binding transpeptidase domain-containing protein [Flammeovirgaceae bacterium SG7u.111]
MEKQIYIRAAFIIIAIIFLVKLLQVQVFDTNYRQAARQNIVSRLVKYPLRGMIYDRNEHLIVRNRPVFDIMVIPEEFTIEDTARFCEIFEVELEFVREKLDAAKRYSRIKPSIFIKQLSTEKFAEIEDRLSDYPGLYPSPRTVRDYPHSSLANALGYVKEVDKKFLDADSSKYYRQGDLIGKSGLEKQYEEELRGIRGVSYVMLNVRGVVKGSFQNGELDTIPEIGKDLVTGIDLELQQYGEKLMQNKRGAIVAIEPSTGEILTMLSFPSYDPNLLTGDDKTAGKNYLELVRDPNKPLFNRAIQAVYPPGSTFKTAMTLVGLQDGTLDSARTYFGCDKSLVGCHNHASPLNPYGSIQHSCNPWYVQAFRKMILTGKSEDKDEDTRLGLQHWHDQMTKFGLGVTPKIDLPFARRGNIPSPEYYDKNYYIKNWRLSNVYSIAFGQGELLVSPLQLANQAAVIANRGWYKDPHLVKSIGDSTMQFEKHQTGIEYAYFDYVARAMSEIYTASMAKIPDIKICGKTGTAQNPHGEDHSIFMAFAPLDNPQIAIAVYVENAGFGGSWAAPIASLMVEQYIKGEVDPKRQWLENYVLRGNFMEQ